ncbi:MAG: sulfatase-like hydrolase/transferase [Clostridia bacterium]|nr:sulfatase-like hydrolase/transferase [Clostridia bacterium]
MRILYIDIDTLRPDHMGAYGYPRNTTPNMDAIALEGTRFNCMYTSDAPCLPSRAALISGMFGIHNGAVGHGGTAADRRLTGADRDFMDQIDLNNFNRIFRRAGMHTVSISTFPERHSSYWFSAGFHETYNQGGCGGESAETLTPIALDWLERRGKEDNWYLHFHLWDPHTPYRAPKEFGNPFENDPVPTFITEKILEGHQHIASPHGAIAARKYV